MTPILELREISHHYTKGVVVLANLDLKVMTGEIACLLGQSGCGKTTALRIVAGFEKPAVGEVWLAGDCVSGRGSRFVPPEKRSVGIVFQDAALFPQLTVGKNIAFGLRGQTKAERENRVDELLKLMDLTAYKKQYPHQLSGGQRQRVALARAMAPKPKLILLDEPFSNLDADLRQTLGADLRDILKESGMTAVLVTHDQAEAFTMADRIALLHEGRIRQVGSADELFHRPVDRFVGGFFGEGSFIRGHCDGRGRIDCVFGKLQAQNSELPAGSVEILIRSENPREEEVGIAAEILSRQFRGAYHRYHLRLPDGQVIEASFPGSHGLGDGEILTIGLGKKVVPVFMATTGGAPG